MWTTILNHLAGGLLAVAVALGIVLFVTVAIGPFMYFILPWTPESSALSVGFSLLWVVFCAGTFIGLNDEKVPFK